jgi:hypothetical protein
MARSNAKLAALALLLAACGGGGGQEPQIDAPSVFCQTSVECGPGSWCNPLGNLCEPRGTTFEFERDIYPELHDVCEGCHVADVPDPQTPGHNISVFAGGPDVAYASLVEGGTNCEQEPHRLCVNEPKASQAVVRLLPHLRENQTLILPDGYADPWMQMLLHWTAAGALRSGTSPPDAGPPDAPPPPPIDAPPPPPIDAPPQPDAQPAAPGRPVITSPVSGASTPPNEISVIWTAAAENGNPITRYDITARRVSNGALTTVTCNAPFSSAPCHINGDQTIGTTITGLANCAAYDVTVTATNIGGSNVSDPVTNVTPRQAPSVPTLPGTPVTRPAVVGQLAFDWNASNANGCGIVSYTVEVDPPAGVSCGGAAGAPCLSSPTTATSFTMTTTAAVCPFPTINCSGPRVWSLRVRAANLGGTTGFSSSASGTPRMGYNRDQMPTIWSMQGCSSCHDNGLPLDLSGNASQQYTEILGTPGVVDLSPTPDPANSLLHRCPTNTNCPQMGIQYFMSGSQEDQSIIRWIADGALE